MLNKLELLAKRNTTKDNKEYIQFYTKCPVCKQYKFSNSRESLLYNMKKHIEKDIKKEHNKLIKLKGGKKK